MSVSTTFPDSTYSSANKPSTATLKADIQSLEDAINALPSLSETLTNKILTNPVINYTDTALTTNVKSRATRSSNQSIPNNTLTKIQLNVESYDVGSDFDAVTNYRFTAPVTGYYIVTARITVDSTADQAILQLDVLKNGSDLTRGSAIASGTGGQSISVSDIVALSSGDYIELWFTHVSGSAKDIVGNNQALHLAAHLISI